MHKSGLVLLDSIEIQHIPWHCLSRCIHVHVNSYVLLGLPSGIKLNMEYLASINYRL